MILNFHKYHGTGNDFIIIDNRSGIFSLKGEKQDQVVVNLCDRHFGIGADGLILLEKSIGYDFRMVYFNADGKEGSFCGNGSRCAVAFAHQIKAIRSRSTRFIAFDGAHHAERIESNQSSHDVIVDLNDTGKPEHLSAGMYFINTGSPHLVIYKDNVSQLDVPVVGRQIRNSLKWKEKGVNVNFVEIIDEQTIAVRTYERGVERETLSCGTGVTAAALTTRIHLENSKENAFIVQTNGGPLMVSFSAAMPDFFSGIKLRGPADFVFSGHIKL